MTQVLKGSFNEYAALTAEQLAKRLAAADHGVEQLTHICAVALRSPTAARALAWAAGQGLKIAFSCLPVGVSGYYSIVSGDIKLSHGYGKDGYVSDSAVESLTHEIRHAWQDARKLLPHFDYHTLRFGRLERTQAQLALCEADAHAVGGIARIELRAAEMTAAERSARMGELFGEWFIEEARLYGEQIRAIHERGMMIPGPAQPVPPRGVDPYDRHHVLALGRDFSGNRNYLAGMDMDQLFKSISNPVDVLSDHNPFLRVENQGAEIRKTQMVNRLWAAGRCQP